jgi:hypothetical protein
MKKVSRGDSMNAIRVRKKLDSDTLHLPELRPLVGRTVEIIVLAEEMAPVVRPGTGDWDAAEKAVRKIKDYDYNALREQDECDRRHANENQP